MVGAVVGAAVAAATAGSVVPAAALAAAPPGSPARPAATAVPEQVHATVPRPAWRPCADGPAGFDCATVEVPSDYDRPRGGTTTIALTRLPATDPARRLGSLFVNPGGPGGSGVDFVQQAAQLVYDPQVLARYDVVGFDPRGVARSDPATCFRTAAEEATSPLFADGYPVTPAQERTILRDGAELALRCQTTSPGRFSTASTANVARDLDLLRQAVGDQRLNYYGYSYGTFLGATYARLFPGRVGRWVLDGTVDPVAWTGTGTGDAAASVPLGVRIRQGAGGTQTFGQFTRLCREAGPDRCPLATLGDPAKTVPALLDRLLAAPIVLPLPDGASVTVTQQILVVAIFQSLYYPAQWRPLADALLELAALRPDGSAAAAALARTSSTLGARIRGEDYPSAGGGLASICVDARQSRRPLAYPAIADQQDAVAPYFGRFRTWVGLPCEYWGLTDEDAFRGPWRQSTREPVVVIGTRYDPATPFSQTAPFTADFPDGRQVTVEGYGHTAAFPNVSTCATALATRWLADGVPPASGGTTCGQDVDPFPATAAARTAGNGYLPAPPAL